MEWNEETIGRLRALWAEGHSTAEIGRRMGVSKNAVVGKAHRLNLAARPSPIRREPGRTPRPMAPRRIVGPTLPPLSAIQAPDIVPLPRPVPSIPRREAAAEIAPAPTIVEPPLRMVTPRRSHACCWPIGEPGTKTFRFCDDEALPNKPYCAEHAQLAYVKIRDRREDAA
jgi:GcrA cell cycle regulator